MLAVEHWSFLLLLLSFILTCFHWLQQKLLFLQVLRSVCWKLRKLSSVGLRLKYQLSQKYPLWFTQVISLLYTSVFLFVIFYVRLADIHWLFYSLNVLGICEYLSPLVIPLQLSQCTVKKVCKEWGKKEKEKERE